MNATKFADGMIKIRHTLMSSQLDQSLFQRGDIPPRSRLYGLEPCELGTIWGESLTSYLNRLGWRHGIPPRILMEQEIVPFVSDRYPARIAQQLATFSRQRAIYLNGTGEGATEWSNQLEQLTTRRDLRYLTLLWWIGDLQSRKLLRSKPAWCPLCYAEWKEKGKPIYQPLIWSLQTVTMCVKHQWWLEDRCPHCQKNQSSIAVRTYPGYCTQCKKWLDVPLNFSKSAVDKTMIRWQKWVMQSLEELLQGSLASGILPWEPFFANLAAKSSFRTLFKLSGMPGVATWYLYRKHPSLAAILEFCYVCGVTPFQVMRNELAPLEQALLGKASPRANVFPHKADSFQIDIEKCQNLLQAVLNGAITKSAVF